MMDLIEKAYLTPPDNEARKAYRCDNCDEWIYEGYPYFEVEDNKYCEDCVEEKIAELDDWNE